MGRCVYIFPVSHALSHFCFVFCVGHSLLFRVPDVCRPLHLIAELPNYDKRVESALRSQEPSGSRRLMPSLTGVARSAHGLFGTFIIFPRCRLAYLSNVKLKVVLAS